MADLEHQMTLLEQRVAALEAALLELDRAGEEPVEVVADDEDLGQLLEFYGGEVEGS